MAGVSDRLSFILATPYYLHVPSDSMGMVIMPTVDSGTSANITASSSESSSNVSPRSSSFTLCGFAFVTFSNEDHHALTYYFYNGPIDSRT